MYFKRIVSNRVPTAVSGANIHLQESLTGDRDKEKVALRGKIMPFVPESVMAPNTADGIGVSIAVPVVLGFTVLSNRLAYLGVMQGCLSCVHDMCSSVRIAARTIEIWYKFLLVIEGIEYDINFLY